MDLGRHIIEKVRPINWGYLQHQFSIKKVDPLWSGHHWPARHCSRQGHPWEPPKNGVRENMRVANATTNYGSKPTYVTTAMKSQVVENPLFTNEQVRLDVGGSSGPECFNVNPRNFVLSLSLFEACLIFDHFRSLKTWVQKRVFQNTQ